MDGLGYRPQNPLQFLATAQVFNPGTPGPRTNLESQGSCPKPWPTIYRIPLRGLGAMPLQVIGPTAPVNVNRYAGGAPGYNVMMPGLSKRPFGG